jgi:hypothetical protein
MTHSDTVTIWPGYTAAMLAGILVGSIGAGVQWGLGVALFVGGIGVAGLVFALIALLMLSGALLSGRRQ